MAGAVVGPQVLGLTGELSQVLGDQGAGHAVVPTTPQPFVLHEVLREPAERDRERQPLHRIRRRGGALEAVDLPKDRGQGKSSSFAVVVGVVAVAVVRKLAFTQAF